MAIVLSQNGVVNDYQLFQGAQTVQQNLSISTGYNAVSAGPVTVASGYTVTVGDDSQWTIV